MSLPFRFCGRLRNVMMCGTALLTCSTAVFYAIGTTLVSPAHAQERVWNGNGGSFDDAANWTPNDIPNAAGESAVFNDAGAANSSVTANINRSFDSLIFNGATGYSIEGGANFTLSGGITNNSSADQSISGFGLELGGSGGIVQQGMGTLRLGFGDTSYTGDTVVNSGTLRAFNLSSAPALGLGTLVLNGGTLGNVGTLDGFIPPLILSVDNDVDINGDIGIDVEGDGGFVRLNGNVDLGADTRVVTVTRGNNDPLSNELILNGTIFGTGGVTYATNGNGAVVVYGGSSANTYTGLTTVGAGVNLRLNKFDSSTFESLTSIVGDLTIDAGGKVTLIEDDQIANSATVTVNGTLESTFFRVTETIGNLQGSGSIEGRSMIGPFTLTVHQGDFSGTITEDLFSELELTKDTAGTLVLSGNNSYSGKTEIKAGTLQIGAGGTTGTLGSGDVINGGALTFNRSDTITVNNRISGGGVVNKRGTGTLELTNSANSYTGGTTIDGGTLRIGASGATGTGTISVLGSTISYADGVDEVNPIDLRANVDLEVLASESATQSGVIGETGASFGVTKTGTGTLTLTAANRYTGPTRVSAGQLSVTGAGTLSSAIIIVDGGTFFTDGGALSAAGDVTVNTGTFSVGGNETIGMLTNSGNVKIEANTTLAATIINNTSGTISVGANATLEGIGNTLNNSATIDVAAGGTVTDAGAINNLATGIINFNGPGGTAALASTTAGEIVNDGRINALSGDVAVTGNLTNQGTGVLNVTGGNMTGITTLTNMSTAGTGVTVATGQTLSADTIINRAGATIFAAGTLNGTVRNEGDLNALGTVNGAFTNTGRLFAGGNGTIWTTFVDGDFVQTDDGSTVIDVDGASSANDYVSVTGTADLAGTVDVNVTNVDPLGLFTILSAAGGVTDYGLALGSVPAFTNPLTRMELVFPNPNDVALSFTFDAAAGSFNPNRTSILNNINAINRGSVGEVGPTIMALFGLGTVQEMASALDQLSPEIVFNTQTAALFSVQNFTNGLFSCPVLGGANAVIREGNCLWVRPNGRFLEADRTSEQIGFDEHVGGISIGGQYEVRTGWHAGFAIGYEHGNLETNSGANAESDRFHAGGALKYRHGPMMIAGAVSGGIGAYDTTRPVAFGGLGAINTANYDINYFGAQLRAAYLMEQGGFYAKPLVDVNLTYLDRDGFIESGNPATALSVGGGSDTTLSVTPAVEAGSEHALPSGWTARTRFKAGVTFYSQNQDTLTARFAGAPTTAPSFQITSELDNVFADLEAGVTLLSDGPTSVEFGYQGRFSSNTSEQGGFIKGALRF